MEHLKILSRLKRCFCGWAATTEDDERAHKEILEHIKHCKSVDTKQEEKQ